MLDLLALNPLNQTDIIFFIVLAVIVVLCVGVYFLIPVFNKKQYKELRDNLEKREVAFKSNIRRTGGASAEQESAEEELTPADSAAADPSEHEEK